VFCAKGDKHLAAMESAVRGLIILKGNGSKPLHEFLGEFSLSEKEILV
jgi:hypothetical protein